MKKAEFVEKTLEFWITTAIPMSAANLQIYTKVPRRKMTTWLREMVSDGVLDLDSDSDGNLLYEVPGARRPSTPKSFAGLKHKKSSNDDLLEGLMGTKKAGKALAKRAKQDLAQTDDGKKSVLVSGGLSFLFPGLGWFYAGSYKEAAIASLAVLGVSAILPSFLLGILAFPAMAISGIGGMVYAWQHNRKGKRVRLLESDDDD